MLRSLAVLLGVAFVTVSCGAEPYIEKFEDWTLICPGTSKHCLIVNDFVNSYDPRYWAKTTIVLVQDELRLSFDLPLEEDAPRQSVHLFGAYPLIGELKPHCTETRCLAVAQLEKREVGEFLKSRFLFLQFKVGSGKGVGFFFKMKGLKEALAASAKH